MKKSLSEVQKMAKNMPDGEYQIVSILQGDTMKDVIKQKHRATSPNVITFTKEGDRIFTPSGKCNPEIISAEW